MKNTPREYGQAFMPEERKQTADEIKALRASRREEKIGTQDVVSSLNKDIAEKQSELESLIKTIDSLEKGMDKESNGLLQKLKDYIEQRKIKEQLQVTTSDKSMLEGAIRMLQRQSKVFESSLQVDRYQNQIDQTLKDFHGKESKEAKEYFELKRELELNNVAKDREGVFIHGTLPMGSPNAALQKGLDLSWEDKIDVLLTVPTAISASLYNNRVDADEDPRFISKPPKFGPVGVFLVGGEIRAAFPRDNGTNIRSREAHGNTLSDLKRVKSELAAIRPGKERGSEFVIKNPKVGGLWFEHGFNISNESKYNSLKVDALKKIGGARVLAKRAQELNVPVYAFHRGEAHEVYFEGDTYRIKEKPVDYEHLREKHPVYMKSAERANNVFGRVIKKNIFTSTEQKRYEKELEEGLKLASMHNSDHQKAA